jgi:hypothetical protein
LHEPPGGQIVFHQNFWPQDYSESIERNVAKHPAVIDPEATADADAVYVLGLHELPFGEWKSRPIGETQALMRREVLGLFRDAMFCQMRPVRRR